MDRVALERRLREIDQRRDEEAAKRLRTAQAWLEMQDRHRGETPMGSEETVARYEEMQKRLQAHTIERVEAGVDSMMKSIGLDGNGPEAADLRAEATVACMKSGGAQVDLAGIAKTVEVNGRGMNAAQKARLAVDLIQAGTNYSEYKRRRDSRGPR